MDYVIEVLPAAGIDQVEPLWHELLHHHLSGAPHLAALGPARTPDDSWGRLLGYAMIRVTSDAGSRQRGYETGILETLVISDAARGAGAGRALLIAARERLAGWGVQIMKISVLAGNESALRFYLRQGAADYLKTLIMPVRTR